MDWKKAKLYLIICLAIVNVALLWSLQFTPFKPVSGIDYEDKKLEKNPDKLAEILIKKNMALSPELSLKSAMSSDVSIKYEKYDLKRDAVLLLANPKKISEEKYSSDKAIIDNHLNHRKYGDVKSKDKGKYILESYDEGLGIYFHREGDIDFPELNSLRWVFAPYSESEQEAIINMVSAVEDIGESLEFERYANTPEGELLMFSFRKDDVVLESGQLLAFVDKMGEVSFKLSKPEISKGQGTQREAIHPAQAIMKLFIRLDKMAEKTDIVNVSLVYRLSISSIESDIEVAGRMASGDALPFWRIYLSDGRVYYIEAI